tara:strand:+ start:13454 stop:14632 length:1179 start_codon:yes stop_codon:yes gene_type:complete
MADLQTNTFILPSPEGLTCINLINPEGEPQPTEGLAARIIKQLSFEPSAEKNILNWYCTSENALEKELPEIVKGLSGYQVYLNSTYSVDWKDGILEAVPPGTQGKLYTFPEGKAATTQGWYIASLVKEVGTGANPYIMLDKKISSEGKESIEVCIMHSRDPKQAFKETARRGDRKDCHRYDLIEGINPRKEGSLKERYDCRTVMLKRPKGGEKEKPINLISTQARKAEYYLSDKEAHCPLRTKKNNEDTSVPLRWSVPASMQLEDAVRMARDPEKTNIIEVQEGGNLGRYYEGLANKHTDKLEKWAKRMDRWKKVEVHYFGDSERIQAQRAENEEGILTKANTIHPGQFVTVLYGQGLDLGRNEVCVADSIEELLAEVCTRTKELDDDANSK